MTKYRGLDRLLRKGVLENIQIHQDGVSPQTVADQMIDSMPEGAHIKNVCAKMSVQLVERLDNTISIIGCSKRRFVECALIAAMERAREIAEEEGLFEELEAAQ